MKSEQTGRGASSREELLCDDPRLQMCEIVQDFVRLMSVFGNEVPPPRIASFLGEVIVGLDDNREP